jgi:EAL domain-containing protein (putative c-di-GMP-specific phosphodiesterase class I)
MLSKIDAEFVKLDRSIVVAAVTESSARAVLMAMATFARQTGAFVIAEGIENEDSLQFLRGIDERDLASHAIIRGGQGFGLGRPSAELSPEWPAVLRRGHGRAYAGVPQNMGTRRPVSARNVSVSGRSGSSRRENL